MRTSNDRVDLPAIQNFSDLSKSYVLIFKFRPIRSGRFAEVVNIKISHYTGIIDRERTEIHDREIREI